jgi:outer membrane protein assembly factor BamA
MAEGRTLEPKAGVSKVEFTWSGESVITDGQSFDGVKAGSDAHSCIAEAGREASEYLADWFKEQSGVVAVQTDCMASCDDDWPKELNFAFTGTITIDGTDYPIAPGQGHVGASGDNNWWLGGGEGFSGKGTVVTPDSLYANYASDPAQVAC